MNCESIELLAVCSVQQSAAVCEAPAAALPNISIRCGWVCDHSRAPGILPNLSCHSS